MTLLQAFAHMEGFYSLHSRPQRNNNPLDLEYGDESTRFGATATDGRFAIFPDVATGWKAGRSWLSIPAKFHQGQLQGYYFDSNGTTLVGGYLGATLAQVVHRFAPAGENDPEIYLATVCKNTGLNPAQKLTLDLLVL